MMCEKAKKVFKMRNLTQISGKNLIFDNNYLFHIFLLDDTNTRSLKSLKQHKDY